MCGGGGGGTSGETTYNWNPSMQPRWDNLLNLTERSLFPAGVDNTYQNLGQFKPYTDQRFAGPSYNERQAIANTSSLNSLADSPVSYTDPYGQFHQGSMNLATDMTQDTLNGRYLMSASARDPSLNQSNPWNSVNPTVETNPWAGVSATVDRNQYAGDSPYAKNLKQQGMQDIVDMWTQGTKQDTDRMAILGGAFGGSDHQKAMANNAVALGRTLGNYQNQFDQGQLDRTTGLEESFIGRNLQNQQLDKQLGGQWGENYLGRNLQNQQNNKQLGWQSGEAALNRESQAYQNERQRQMAAAGMGYGEQGLALDRINALMQTGALSRQLGDPYTGQVGQNQLDFNYSQQQEANNWPFKLMQLLSGQYSTAQGNTGQQTQAYGGGNNVGQILGGLLGAYSLT